MHSIIFCDCPRVEVAAIAIELKYDAIIKAVIEFFPLLERFTAWNVLLESKFEICAGTNPRHTTVGEISSCHCDVKAIGVVGLGKIVVTLRQCTWDLAAT